MNWLLINYSESATIKIADALRHKHISYKIISLADVYTKDFERSEDTIVYGPVGSVNYMSRKYGFKSWCDLPNLRLSKYITYYYDHLINKDGAFYPLDLIIRGYRDFKNIYTLFDCLGGEDKIFIRPDSNDKIFTGYLATIEDLERLREVIGGEILCYVAKPIEDLYKSKDFEEYRFCVVDNMVVTGSRYLPTTSTKIPKTVKNKADEIAKIKYDGQPEIFVLDLVRDLKTGDVEMLELGAINTAGWYEMNHEIIVDVCSRSDHND